MGLIIPPVTRNVHGIFWQLGHTARKIYSKSKEDVEAEM